MKSKILGSLAVGLLAGPIAGHAAPLHLLLESNANVESQEVFAVTYNSFADVLSNTIASQGFSALNINEDFSAGGFTYDGSQFHLLLESNANVESQEVFAVTYNSFADVLSNTIASQGFSALNINEDFSAGGFTYDGSQFHLLLESNANVESQEVFAVTYNSFADFLSNTIASQGFSALNINEDFSAGGFTYDGSQFHLLLESNANVESQEVFAVTYNSFADFLSNTIASQGFSALNINEDYSIAGFASEWQVGTPVPEPGTLALLALGLAGLGLSRRRKAD